LYKILVPLFDGHLNHLHRRWFQCDVCPPPQSSWTRSRLSRKVADYGGIVDLDRRLI
jgi:hypothetical protein